MNVNAIKDQRGLSLIELMIAMALGIFITGGMLQLFINSKQSYRVQENISRLQENGRFAMDFISKDVRMADYWGCLSDSTFIDNNLNTGSIYDDFSTTIVGTNNDGLNGSDSITISGVAASGIFVVDTPASTSANLKVTDESGLLQNDIVLVSDCVAGDIFQITNDPSTGNAGSKDEVVHNKGSVSSGPGNNDKSFQKIYGTDAQIYNLRTVSYSIAAGASGQPALFRSINGGANQELFEGFQSMQILYGVDTNGDNTANYYKSSDALTLTQMDQVKSIRISLLASTLDDNLVTQAVPYTIFGSTITPTDRRIRRVFTSTIAVRNRLL